MVGFNLAGLDALEATIKAKDAVDVFEEAFGRQKKKKKAEKRRRRIAEVERALLTLQWNITHLPLFLWSEVKPFVIAEEKSMSGF